MAELERFDFDTGNTRDMDGDDAAAFNAALHMATSLHRQQQARRERNPNATPGICEDCEQFIPEDRLQAIQDATRCVACQTLYEKGNS